MSEFVAFQNRVKHLYVVHPEVERIWSRLDQNRRDKREGIDSDDSPTNLFIEGLPGAGKTQCAKKYLRRNPLATIIDDEKTEIDERPVLFMNLPIPFTYKGFYNNILKSINENFPITQKDVDMIKNQAFGLMKALKVEMLIIDEMDYLLASTYVQRKAVMENIKDIANSADVCLVCIGTHAIEELRTFNTQHLRRYPKTVLGHFQKCDEKFFNFIGSIEKQLEVPPPVILDWSDRNSYFAPMLFEITRGLVGWVKPILREAMTLVGVFNEDFNDFNVLNNIDGAILEEAQKNVIGDFAEDDMDKIMENHQGDSEE